MEQLPGPLLWVLVPRQGRAPPLQVIAQVMAETTQMLLRLKGIFGEVFLTRNHRVHTGESWPEKVWSLGILGWILQEPIPFPIHFEDLWRASTLTQAAFFLEPVLAWSERVSPSFLRFMRDIKSRLTWTAETQVRASSTVGHRVMFSQSQSMSQSM
jgi:hypothetical protein